MIWGCKRKLTLQKWELKNVVEFTLRKIQVTKEIHGPRNVCYSSHSSKLSSSIELSMVCPPTPYPVIIHHNPSISVIIRQYPSLSVIIRFYPSLSVFIRLIPSLSVFIHLIPSFSVFIRLFRLYPSLFVISNIL